MAKNQAAKKPPTETRPARLGYKRATSRVELAGYWLPEHGPLHGILGGGFEFKQKSGRGKGKLRVTYVLKLLEPCVARVKLEGGGYDTTELKAGEIIGVFGGPGLRDLMQYYTCKVVIERLPQKKSLASGNEMWDYTIDYAGTRRQLPVRKWVPSDENTSEPEEDDAVEADGDASFNPDDFAF